MLNTNLLKLYFALFLLGISLSAQAECGNEVALDFWFETHSHQWTVVESSEGVPENSAEIVNYKTDYGVKRKDTRYCAAYYCLSSVEIEKEKSHQGVYFFQWGGTSFPNANEQSIVYSDKNTGETCLIRHTGGEQFAESGVKLVESQKANKE